MDNLEVAEIARTAAKDAVAKYLSMCGLDSPWEVPECYMAMKAFEALGNEKRVALESRVQRGRNFLAADETIPACYRLDKKAAVDVAMLRSDGDPWSWALDGIVEFKRHKGLRDDADLIWSGLHWKDPIHYGVLVLFLVGASREEVERALQPFLDEVNQSGERFVAVDKPDPQRYEPLPDTKVNHRWWDVRCIVPVKDSGQPTS